MLSNKSRLRNAFLSETYSESCYAADAPCDMPRSSKKNGVMTNMNENAFEEEQYTASEYLEEAESFLRTLASLLYKELTQEQIDALRAYDFMSMRNDTENEDLSNGFYGLGRYLKRCGVNVRQDLAVEYARIFLAAGVADGIGATPYESVFTSPEGLLMQDARDEVVKIYRKQGMKVDKELNDPEDHLAFEIQFLANMCEKTRAALDAEEDVKELVGVQVDFIDNHIFNWINALMDKVDEYAMSGFYPSVMQVIRGYLTEHKAILNELVQEV